MPSTFMPGPRLSHDMLVYVDDDGFVETVSTVLQGGLERNEAVITVLPHAQWALLEDELGDSSGDVSHTDNAAFYTRPEAALAAYDTKLRMLLRAGVPAITLVGELPLFGTQSQRDAFTCYEAILNEAFAAQPVSVLCTYDARTHPAEFLEAAHRTHQCVQDASGAHLNDRYDEPAGVVRELAPRLAGDLRLRPIAVEGGAPAIRERVASAMAAAQVRGADALDMILAVTEVLDNAERHGGGVTSVRAGAVSGGFVCEVADRGPGLDDPLAGYLPPDPELRPASGLWSARQLTRRVEIGSGRPGTIVRLWV